MSSFCWCSLFCLCQPENAGLATRYAGLEAVQYDGDSNDVCYQVQGTLDHDWGNETLLMSFFSPSDVTAYQVLWSEDPLFVGIEQGKVFAYVGPRPGLPAEQKLLFASLPIEAEVFYQLSLGMDSKTAILSLNEQQTVFFFPEVFPAADPDSGESSQGPALFSEHEGPIYMGCQAERHTERVGGPGGGESPGKFTCPSGGSVSVLKARFQNETGSSIVQLQVVCEGGTESEWLGNNPDSGDLIEESLSLEGFSVLRVQHGDLVNMLSTGDGSHVGPTPADDADDRNPVQTLDCKGAPLIGISVFYGEAIDAISLSCGKGGFFRGHLMSAVRWRQNLPAQQIAASAAQLGQVVWDFRSQSPLEFWTVVEKQDNAAAPYFPQRFPNGSVLYNELEPVLELPLDDIIVAQTPTFTFADLLPKTYPPPYGYQTAPPNAPGTAGSTRCLVPSCQGHRLIFSKHTPASFFLSFFLSFSLRSPLSPPDSLCMCLCSPGERTLPLRIDPVVIKRSLSFKQCVSAHHVLSCQALGGGPPIPRAHLLPSNGSPCL